MLTTEMYLKYKEEKEEEEETSPILWIYMV